jgi:flagellin-specific chaperone FliS
MNNHTTNRVDIQLIEGADSMLSRAEVAFETNSVEQVDLYLSQSLAIFQALLNSSDKISDSQRLYKSMITQTLAAYEQERKQDIGKVREMIHNLID